MKTNIILLLNAFVMFLVSFTTDYWMYRGHDLHSLVPLLRLEGCNVTGWDGTFAWQKMVLVQCRSTPGGNTTTTTACEHPFKANRANDTCSTYLFSEYGNLYRECNDLLGTSSSSLYCCFYLRHCIAIDYTTTMMTLEQFFRRRARAIIPAATSLSAFVSLLCDVEWSMAFVSEQRGGARSAINRGGRGRMRQQL